MKIRANKFSNFRVDIPQKKTATKLNNNFHLKTLKNRIFAPLNQNARHE